ncbi:hypothetical protein [Hansschlegelia beijingensis]|uniref:Uncharacterized protein n=1 Tax=Hansschlegelia beijingensis TaxID=1133344 RepID=A0A7W6D1B0_9HYPH|nr:hypothetical protein [Hansschlegelia beijingensis]MBB3972836.1 hypothetical protein [Hansschlegelia beijingensis]
MSRSQRSRQVAEAATRPAVTLATSLFGAAGFVQPFFADRSEACGCALTVPDHED